MSLVPDYGDSSDSAGYESDSQEPSQTEDTEDKSENRIEKAQETLNKITETAEKWVTEKSTLPKPKLPPPDFCGSTTSSDLPKTSVFKNPFIEAENEKTAILQKHVKMVESKDNVAVINGKKICWNYRKGRCRFGHNCKYAHDSDIQKSQEQLDAEKQALNQQYVACSTSQMAQPTPNELEQIKEESIQNKQKRKRPGLTHGLVPGKKVMKQYMSLKS